MKKQSLQQKALTHFAVKQRNNYYKKEYKLGSLRKKKSIEENLTIIAPILCKSEYDLPAKAT
jgi:hypothetical protein